jgi:tetratricopeptide (TPR) repeat protein
MATPTMDRFLSETSRVLSERNGAALQDILIIQPPFANTYNEMIAEVRRAYPVGFEEQLEVKCSDHLPEARDGGEDGATWGAFISFVAQYFAFIRDVNIDDLLETYNQLSELVQKSNVALAHQTFGIVIFPTVIAYSKMLTRLAIGLERRPDLMAQVSITIEQPSEDGERITLPERAANMIRNAFVVCLNDRSGGPTGIQDGQPAGKKVGIYKFANLCLKILFECKKIRNAEQIINNIHKSSPRLSAYPRAERVTYLYYLGRFHFSMGHFWRAIHCLQAAYDECPRYAQCQKQRRLILTYLVTANIILGRFPSAYIYNKPEAYGFQERFMPICAAIAKGDLTSFRRLTDFKHEHANWFIKRRIFFQLRERCEVLVWRSLARKTFILGPDQKFDKDSRRAPTLNLEELVHAFVYLEKRAMNPLKQTDGGPGNRHTNWLFMSDTPPASTMYEDPEFEDAGDSGYDEPDPLLLPDLPEIESIVASLVEQGLLNGFISHRSKRFAIQGARTRDAKEAGFPNVWDVVKGRMDEMDIPGWKKNDAPLRSLGGVVRLSGVKGIGGED